MELQGKLTYIRWNFQKSIDLSTFMHIPAHTLPTQAVGVDPTDQPENSDQQTFWHSSRGFIQRTHPNRFRKCLDELWGDTVAKLDIFMSRENPNLYLYRTVGGDAENSELTNVHVIWA